MGQFYDELRYLALACGLSFLLSLFSGWLLTRAYVRNATAPWYERARLLWPSRINLATDVLFLPLIFSILPYLEPRHVKPLISPFAIWASVFISVVHASFIAQRYWSPLPPLRYADFWKRWAVQQFGLGSPIIVAILSNFIAEDEWTTYSTIQAIATLLFFIACVFGVPVLLFRTLGWIIPPTPRLRNLIESVSASLAVPPPKSFILPLLSPNAYAFPSLRQLWFDDKLVDSLSDQAVAAIIRHEMSHLSESRWIFVTRLIFIPFLLTLALARPLIGTLGVQVWLLLFLCVIIAAYFAKRIWRKMEVRADAAAADGDTTEREYSRALEQLYEINLIPAVIKRKNQTHPDLYDRLVNVGAPPPYPRPKPPPRFASITFVMIKTGLASFIAARQAFFPW